MDIGFFFKGIIIGFIVAVPVGPIGILCINRALSGGPAYGLFSGLGVATADAIAAAIAALGLTVVSGFFLDQEAWLRVVGGFFLCYLGFRTFSIRPQVQSISTREYSPAGAYSSAFLLTFSNPVTVLSFVAIYAGLGVGNLSGAYFAAALLASGVFFGSAIWWIVLGGGLLAFGKKFAYPGLRWVHRISGVIIVGFGFVAIFGG